MGKPNANRLANHPLLRDRLFDTPLMVWDEKLRVILGNVIGPKLGVTFVIGNQSLQAQDDLIPEAPVEREDAQKEGRLMRLQIVGSLVRRATGFDAMSGLSSYEQIGAEIDEAMADDSVKGILIEYDTPGGEVNGVFDLADKIYEARQVKPVYAIASDYAASAGYLLASSATKVFASQTAVTGSIGVIAIHADFSRMYENHGVKITEITYGARKGDGAQYKPLSDEALARIQARVDQIGSLFVGAVARNRNLAADTVAGTEAGVFLGSDAVDVGLVDEISTLEGALESLEAATQPTTVQVPSSDAPTSGGRQMSTKGKGSTTKLELSEEVLALLPEGAEPATTEEALQLVARAAQAEATKRATIEKANAELDERLAAIEAERNLEKFHGVAAGFKHLAADTGMLASVLMEANQKLETGTYESLVTVLREADAQVKYGELYSERGAVSDDTETGMTALEIANERARKLMSEDGSLTIQSARAKVFKADKALRAQYAAERREVTGTDR